MIMELVQLGAEGGDQNERTAELVHKIKESDRLIDSMIDSLSQNIPKNVSMESLVNILFISLLI